MTTAYQRPIVYASITLVPMSAFRAAMTHHSERRVVVAPWRRVFRVVVDQRQHHDQWLATGTNPAMCDAQAILLVATRITVNCLVAATIHTEYMVTRPSLAASIAACFPHPC